MFWYFCLTPTWTVVMAESGFPVCARYCRGPSYLHQHHWTRLHKHYLVWVWASHPCSSLLLELPGLLWAPALRSLNSIRLFWAALKKEVSLNHNIRGVILNHCLLLRPLLPLLLLYDTALLVQLVLSHVGAGDVVHPGEWYIYDFFIWGWMGCA